MSRHCSASDVTDGLSPHNRCGDSATLPPTCASSSAWTLSLHSNGTGHSATRSAARCAREAFDTYLCSMASAPAGSALPRPPDWAFSDDPPSVGKFVARWAMTLYLRSTATAPVRHVLPSSEVRGWQWLPTTSSCGTATGVDDAWLIRDVCAGVDVRILSPPLPRRSASLSKLMLGFATIAAGNSSGRWKKREDPFWVATAGGGVTAAGLWWAGQLVRLVRSSLGPCGRVALATETRMAAAAGKRRAGERRFTVAVHMRRGDACMRWAQRGDGNYASGRPCYRAAEYMDGVRELIRVHGKSTGRRVVRARLLVASDSTEAVAELTALGTAEGLDVDYVQARIQQIEGRVSLGWAMLEWAVLGWAALG